MANPLDPGAADGSRPGDFDETATADREADDETLLADRQADAETIIVDRDRSAAGGPAEGTHAVTRDRRGRGPGGNGGGGMPATGRRRRGMTMPPVAPGYGRGAVEAVGPGAVATYSPRPIGAPPPLEDRFAGVEPTRASAAGMPSVQRRARRTGLIALTAFVVACIVSVAGLIALGAAVLSP